ncbi:acyl-CoA desaturase (plasmid) [Streptomyces sp. NBC_01387]|uniref:fatty acid desaturase family protein n=1 Tax=unclassified Streptomyces TaxID=2593676 RepID=UPI002023F297|nr:MULTISPECIES: acyl-CoA desaturase [unclassified Streptomyces]MCX4554406.1 acyl-CoA desaturase [Streptomyces sp. NBC_01500]WSC25214.1 acyl-CoA desaturase [Streptomyces sp. NBC_01766]WSV58910.1 acyl-CoA desaturase [Streptomyces sp. NBC_01014]
MQSPNISETTSEKESDTQRPLEAGLAVATGEASSQGASATFGELLKRVKTEGLLDLNTGYDYRRLALNMSLILAGLVAFLLIGESWWQMPVAVWMGLCGVQSAYMWHEVGHKAMFRDKKVGTLVAYFHANFFSGVSYAWWVNHHNRHHSHPNHLTLDPDIGRRTAIFDIKQYATRTRTQRFIVRHQRILFFVLLVLEGYKMEKTTVKELAKSGAKRRFVEIGLVVLRTAIYLTAVFTVLTPLQAIVFIAVQHAALGVYFGLMFAPNHKGMEVRDGEKETLDWLERQVLTSRNIRPNWWIDFLYGGLNYQVEHHLFPAMPKRNLARARELTRDYCAERGIPYLEVGFWESYNQVATFLHEVSAPTRQKEIGAAV